MVCISVVADETAAIELFESLGAAAVDLWLNGEIDLVYIHIIAH